MAREKDWSGNKGSTYTTIGASNHSEKDREINDYYATDPTAIDDLFNVEDFTKEIWEPACGGGHLSKRISKHGKIVYSTDLINRGYGDEFYDFLTTDKYWSGDIITNPPFKYAEEFIEKSMSLLREHGKLALFLKITFLEGQRRKKLFAQYPPKTIYVYSKRKNCAHGGDFETYNSNSAICYCWYIGERGYSGDTIIKWI